MRFSSVNYRKDRPGAPEQALVSTGFWFRDLPRLTWRCWLWGHKPVVDGVGNPDVPHSGYVARWVACDRCGLRPEPQGNLPHDERVGEPYEGFQLTTPDVKLGEMGPHAPGPFPKNRGEIGGQVVVLGGLKGASINFTVGCPGSEYDMSGHITLGRFFSLYLHTQGFGRWLQRRFNNVGYHCRVTGIRVHDKTFWWDIWRRDGMWSRSDPGWMSGHRNLDPRVWYWGEQRYWFEKIGKPLASVLSMPEEDYPVNLQLQQVERGRERGRRKHDHWAVDVRVVGVGVPTEPHGHGQITGFGVKVSEDAVNQDMWETEALAQAQLRMTQDRVRRRYSPAREAVE